MGETGEGDGTEDVDQSLVRGRCTRERSDVSGEHPKRHSGEEGCETEDGRGGGRRGRRCEVRLV